MIVIALSVLLIVFFIWRNRKDERDLEQFLNKNESPVEDREDDELNDSI